MTTAADLLAAAMRDPSVTFPSTGTTWPEKVEVQAPPPPPAAGEATPKAQTQPAGDPLERLSEAELADLNDAAIAWHDADALAEKAKRMKEEAAHAVKRHLRPGESYVVPGTGVGVQVKRPSRAFDMDAAWALLTPEQREACMGKPTRDPGLVKAHLKTAGRLDDAMVPGSGDGSVVAK